MLKAGSHSACSTNWNSGVAASKPAQMKSDSAQVTSDVHSAIQRALRATTSGAPRRTRMNAAPRSGRNVVSDRIGKELMPPSPTDPQQVPAHHDDDADQDGEGVVVEIAGLQPAGAH